MILILLGVALFGAILAVLGYTNGRIDKLEKELTNKDTV